MRTAAVISLWNLTGGRRRARAVLAQGPGFRDAAVAALPLLELGDGLEEVARAEVGPEDRRHVDLGVGDLPEEVVRDAHLAARADEEVGVGQTGRVETRLDRGLVDLLGLEASGLHLHREGAHRVRELGPPRVVERDVEDHALAVRRRVPARA